MYWLLCEVRRVRREYKDLEDRLAAMEDKNPDFYRNGPDALLLAEGSG